MRPILSTVLSIALAAVAFPAGAEVARTDLTVASEDGLQLFVRRFEDDAAREDRGPFLLINGGRPGVLASWDVDKPGPSVAALLAKAGHTVYLMDARGFGRSEHPPSMRDGMETGPVAVRSHEVVRDIAAVVADIKRRHPGDARLAATGWATGSQWLGHYASLYPQAVSRLVYYQGAYGGAPGGWAFQSVADPDDPAMLDRARFAAFRCSTAEQMTARMREETDDQAFLERYAALAVEGDERAATREPPCFRFPSGPLADTLMLVNGRPLFDVGAVAGHVLILRSENDFWSRPADVAALRAHLGSAASVTVKEFPDASHFIHLLPETRQSFVDAVLSFTAPDANAVD